MGCNCGNKAPKEFIYTDGENGTQHTHTTLVSARAAQIRDKKAGKPTGSIREQVKVKR